MKLKDLVLEAAIIELRKSVLRAELFESITEYIDGVIRTVKVKKDQAFEGPNAIDVEHLAKIISGMKMLSSPSHRSAMTKDDIGIDPTKVADVFKLMNSVSKTGKDPKETENTFNAIRTISKTSFDTELQKLELLKSGDDSERAQVLKDLEKFYSNLQASFDKVKTRAQSTSATV